MATDGRRLIGTEDREAGSTSGRTAAPSEGAQPKACSACGAGFACGAASGRACWCADLPPLTSLSPGADCLCPACLAEAVGRIGDRGRSAR